MTGGNHPVDGESVTTTLLDLAVESWRFARAVDRLLVNLDESRRRRHESRLRWFQKRLDESLADVEMRIVSIEEGQAFDPGMAATPLNIGDFGSEDALVVEQMLEPIIMGPAGIVRTGTVRLKKVEQ